jgi:hypothetical protein
MAITNRDQDLINKSGLGPGISVFSIFSFFLENNAISLNGLDLNHIPIEYVIYISYLYDYINESGDLILITMLFLEYYHKSFTGHSKLYLSDEKYKIIASQFALFCRLEIKRRKKHIIELSEQHMFNPNIKTIIYISPLKAECQMMVNALHKLNVSVNNV